MGNTMKLESISLEQAGLSEKVKFALDNKLYTPVED